MVALREAPCPIYRGQPDAVRGITCVQVLHTNANVGLDGTRWSGNRKGDISGTSELFAVYPTRTYEDEGSSSLRLGERA